MDSDTRNVKVQATVANRDEKLRPGMFVNVAVGLPGARQVLTIPATAVLYAPYGDSVFVVDARAKDGKGARSCASSSCAWARSAAISWPSPAA